MNASFMNHITLTTGHNRRSPRAEVSDRVVKVMATWLRGAIAAPRPVPLPAEPLQHFSARALTDPGGVAVTVYGPFGPHAPGKPFRGEGIPLVTFGVARRSRNAASLWDSLTGAVPVAPGLEMPSTPWCAVALHPTLAKGLFPDAVEWLGSFERSTAWAWIDGIGAAE